MINQIHIFRLFLLVCLLGCSNQFKIEKNSSLTVKEFYYQEWVSGLKGGGSGYNIFLFLDKNSMNSDFQIQGVYFREKYCKLKSQGDNKYQGFIKTSKNIIPNISDNRAFTTAVHVNYQPWLKFRRYNGKLIPIDGNSPKFKFSLFSPL